MEKWADDEFRSVNGQLEWMINKALKDAKRLKKSDYLRAEITQIRANHREKASRELTPLALDIHKKALKSKELTIKEKREWVSMAEKLEFGEDRLPGMTVDKIQIAQLQVYQTLVSDNMDKG